MTESTSPILFAGRQFPPNTEIVDLVNARFDSLEPVGNLPELRVLRLHHTNPHRSAGGSLLDLSVLRKCQHLTVLEIPRQNVRALDGLESHGSLQTVNISFTRVAEIDPLAFLANLVILQLRHTRVTRLAPLASVSTLEELDIAHTNVTDISVLRQLPALTSLDLRATQVTDLTPLADMAALRRVVIERLEVDRAAIDRLRKARPDVDVIA